MNTQRLCAVTATMLAMLIAVRPAEAAGLLVPAGSTTPLEIEDHSVSVTIQNGYVVTEIEQIFANPGNQPLEAVYSFPVPIHAAVAEFTYWIDGKPVTGEVFPKQQARNIYEQQKAAGNETALAEKDEYRTFEISVFPLQPDQNVRTRLVYLQTADTDTGIGRYVYPLEEGGVDEERVAFWEIRDRVTGQFRFELEIRSGYPIDAVRVPDQPGAKIAQLGDGHWRVELGRDASVPSDEPASQQAMPMIAPPAGMTFAESLPGIQLDSQSETDARLDSDLVVYWRHQPGLPGSVDLLAYRPDDAARGTFMLTLTPGDDLPPIADGRDWIFVLDASGSMEGKFATLSEGIRQALGQLDANDRFRIIYFNSIARELTGSFVNATPQNVHKYVDVVSALRPSASTNLHAGLDMAISRIDADRPTGIALVTDGVANTGLTQKKDFLDLLRNNDVRLFTFIMGNSANIPLLEAMTDVSSGFAMTVSNSDDVGGQLRLATGKLTHHAMHDIQIELEGIRAEDLQPTEIGSLYRGDQLVLMGHYWRPGDANITLTGTVAGKSVSYDTQFRFPAADSSHPELERLWAYRTIEHLQARIDYFGADADTEQAITDLAVDHGLVTDYTSMLVVGDQVFESLGTERRNRDRIANERKARSDRATTTAATTRVDQQRPMFTQPRPSTGSSGGGAIGFELIGLLALGLLRIRRRAQRTWLEG